MAVILAPCTLLLLAADPDVGPLSIADLPAYRAALETRPQAVEPAMFRDLWSHPERFRGKPVSVEGRVARRFQQPAIGEFPALSEIWIVSPAGDPTCLILPSKAASDARMGHLVRFSGTFLRLIRYRSGDADRLAPLIVGGGTPKQIYIQESINTEMRSVPTSTEILLGVAAAGIVAMVLGVQHLRKPPRRPVEQGPAPTFSDREDQDEGD